MHVPINWRKSGVGWPNAKSVDPSYCSGTKDCWSSTGGRSAEKCIPIDPFPDYNNAIVVPYYITLGRGSSQSDQLLKQEEYLILNTTGHGGPPKKRRWELRVLVVA